VVIVLEGTRRAAMGTAVITAGPGVILGRAQVSFDLISLEDFGYIY